MLSYHLIPGEVLTSEQLEADLVLQTSLGGQAGEIRVSPSRALLGCALEAIVSSACAARGHHLGRLFDEDGAVAAGSRLVGLPSVVSAP